MILGEYHYWDFLKIILKMLYFIKMSVLVTPRVNDLQKKQGIHLDNLS